MKNINNTIGYHVTNFHILKSFLTMSFECIDKIEKMHIVIDSNPTNIDDPMLFDVTFTTISGKKGIIKRYDMVNFQVYRLFFDGNSIHSFTDIEYKTVAPSWADDMEMFFAKFKELESIYNRYKEGSIKLREQFVAQLKGSLMYAQEMFHNGYIEEHFPNELYNKKYSVEFINEDLYSQPEFILFYKEEDNLSKFIYNMN
jgi:hypothetical protein